MQLRPSKAVFVVVVSLLLSCSSVLAQTGVTTQTGMLPDGATYLIEVPPNWNGILFLYSHGYVPPGSKNSDLDATITRDTLIT